MTEKAALAGLAQGGGKAVIIGDPTRVKTPDLLHDFAAAVNSLDGRYVTAEDVGTTQDDMDRIRETTPFVAVRLYRAADLAIPVQRLLSVW